MLAAIPGRAHFCPAAEDVGKRQAPEEAPSHVSAAVGHGVGIGPIRLSGVPTLRSYRHKGLDRRVGLRRPSVDNSGMDFLRGQHAINLSGADGEYDFADLRWELSATLLVVGQQVSEHRF